MESHHLALAHLLPLIGSINSLYTVNINPVQHIYNADNCNKEYAKMMSTVLAQAKILETRLLESFKKISKLGRKENVLDSPIGIAIALKMGVY
jgi:hypothetical protein